MPSRTAAATMKSSSSGGRRKKSSKNDGATKAPPLPPETPDDADVEVSDEDVQYFRGNPQFARFLSGLERSALDREVLEGHPKKKQKQKDDYGSASDVDAIMAQHESRARASWAESDRAAAAGGKSTAAAPVQQRANRGTVLSVDPADALPVKLPDGRLVYRRAEREEGEEQRGKRGGKEEDEEGEAAAAVGGGQKGKRKEKAAGGKGDDDREPEDSSQKSVILREDYGGDEGSAKGDDHSISNRQGPRKSVKAVDKEQRRVAALREAEAELSAEERRDMVKTRIAEVCMSVLAAPEAQVGQLRELQELCSDNDTAVAQLATLSLAAVFRDVIPGYRIRIPTEKERSAAVSKEVRKLWEFEASLLKSYEAFVAHLTAGAKSSRTRTVSVRALCALVCAAPHFNLRSTLLQTIVPRIDSLDDAISAMCRDAVRDVMSHEGKHGGEATVECAELIADLVRQRSCGARPEVLEPFLALKFDENLLIESSAHTEGPRKGKGWKGKDSAVGPGDDPAGGDGKKKKLSKAEKKKLAAKLRREVAADFRESEAVVSAEDRKRTQSKVLAAVFEAYFRVIKVTAAQQQQLLHQGTAASTTGSSGTRNLKGSRRPLLAPTLEGLVRFSHLISVEFLPDVLATLRQLSTTPVTSDDDLAPSAQPSSFQDALANGKTGRKRGRAHGPNVYEMGGGEEDKSMDDDEEDEEEDDEGEGSGRLTPAERLRCITVAHRIMAANLDALNVDMRAFHVELFRVLPETVTGGSGAGSALAEALEVALLRGQRQTDMQRCAAFVKRLASTALHLSPPDAIAVLLVVRQLLQRYPRCRILLETEPGGGPVGTGILATHHPHACEPELSGALSTVLWDLTLLIRHYHPVLAALAADISKMVVAPPSSSSSSVASSGVLALMPAQALVEYACADGTFRPPVRATAVGGVWKKGKGGGGGAGDDGGFGPFQTAGGWQEEVIRRKEFCARVAAAAAAGAALGLSGEEAQG